MPWLRRVVVAVALVSALAVLAGFGARWALAPRAGEWAVPVQVGPLQLRVGVPGALRILVSPWVGPLLDGRSLRTRHGMFALGWDMPRRTLTVACSACAAVVPGLGAEPLRIAQATLTVRRDFDRLQGTIAAASPDGGAVLRATWQGALRQDGLALSMELPATALAQWYAVLAPTLPELAHARIDGTLGVRAAWSLPGGRLELRPQVEGFAVYGLGTEALSRAASGCGAGAGLRNDAWLARAVIAAEDQRFDAHPGYDLQELLASFDGNQARGQVERGGSTLTQQLAKMVVAGDARSATRKLRELLYAVEMERTLGKTRILQLYLDNAPWGAGLCGAEAAARHYFGRSARSLAPVQAVALAVLLHNPEREARQWAASGAVDRVRARRIAEDVRGIPGWGPRARTDFLRTVPQP
ncbi:biosynthetic peptidoglycan transglycosylase [Xylophilus sp. Leaf220]|uniref:biosynthetic peptidoglycan transglycosylase n=1 Tax=Xylophilus sp. Leaf220 TaxID=1735686 RepID=UPI0006F7842A|nr:biosynthetic peptidoglycan transglycosylase [Xylophilus sp. Leaf220]KQM80257.1 hypothetical protein ASE76_03680 [Xylophilus sp. Leaf220]